MKRLLIVYHTQTGNTERLVRAAENAANQELDAPATVVRALEGTASHLEHAAAIIFATPENFGTMSGGLKNFFDRTYDQARETTSKLPFALLISAGNDGSGAVREVRRILKGYNYREIAEPVVIVGPPTEAGLERAAELGLTLAAGLQLGIY